MPTPCTRRWVKNSKVTSTRTPPCPSSLSSAPPPLSSAPTGWLDRRRPSPPRHAPVNRTGTGTAAKSAGVTGRSISLARTDRRLSPSPSRGWFVPIEKYSRGHCGAAPQRPVGHLHPPQCGPSCRASSAAAALQGNGLHNSTVLLLTHKTKKPKQKGKRLLESVPAVRPRPVRRSAGAPGWRPAARG